MYNEDDILFTRSMTAVMKNIAHLCGRNRSRVWGPDGWKKIVVCVVSDGRSKINQRVLKILGIMGCYQDGIAKNEVNGKQVQAHIFEYTTQIAVDSDLKIRGAEKGFVPVQVLFCLKEQVSFLCEQLEEWNRKRERKRVKIGVFCHLIPRIVFTAGTDYLFFCCRFRTKRSLIPIVGFSTPLGVFCGLTCVC
jgi:hypothetical protein